MAIKIALAGNPNCGKTTLFNSLTGSNQYVGNWPGVTVEKKEGKLLAAIIDVLDDMSGKFEDLEDELCDVEDGLDAVSDDLCEVEEALYELEDDDDEYDEDEDDDEEYFETTCPVCEEEIVFDEDTLESGEIRCPNCGEKLEFDLSDLADAEDEDQE